MGVAEIRVELMYPGVDRVNFSFSPRIESPVFVIEASPFGIQAPFLTIPAHVHFLDLICGGENGHAGQVIG